MMIFAGNRAVDALAVLARKNGDWWCRVLRKAQENDLRRTFPFQLSIFNDGLISM